MRHTAKLLVLVMAPLARTLPQHGPVRESWFLNWPRVDKRSTLGPHTALFQ